MPDPPPPFPGYLRAAIFADDQQAARAFQAIRRAVRDHALALACFRVKLATDGATSYVVVLGEAETPQPLRHAVEAALFADGTAATPPLGLLVSLAARRIKKAPPPGEGGRYEESYRPGLLLAFDGEEP